ncbi:MAG: response regulator [Candidatus Hermodarchaeota archaeon]
MNDKKILFVEDNRLLLSLAIRYFTTLNHKWEIDTANSGDEALEILENKEYYYDVIISDYSMPGMTGLDLLKSLRKQGIQINFIIFTGTTGIIEQEIKDTLKGLTNTQYVQKGFLGMQTLYNTLQLMFQQKKLKTSQRRTRINSYLKHFRKMIV